MCSEARLAELENEASAVVANEDLPQGQKADRLDELRQEFRDCLRQHGPLLATYGRRARGRPAAEADRILAEILNSPEAQGLTALAATALLAILYPGAWLGAPPGFPLPAFPKPQEPQPALRPRF
jgi:hypothetical protein